MPRYITHYLPHVKVEMPKDISAPLPGDINFKNFKEVIGLRIRNLDLGGRLENIVKSGYLTRFRSSTLVEKGMVAEVTPILGSMQSISGGMVGTLEFSIALTFHSRLAKFYIRKEDGDPKIKVIHPKRGHKVLAVPTSGAVAKAFGRARDWNFETFYGAGKREIVGSKKVGGRGSFGEVRYIAHAGKRPFLGMAKGKSVIPLYIFARSVKQWKRIDFPDIIRDFRIANENIIIETFRAAAEELGQAIGRTK